MRRIPIRPAVRARVRAATRRSVPESVWAAFVVTVALLLIAAAARAEDDRTLEAVTIEGEVRLPQVLFITSRDVDRPMDWLDHYDVPLAAPDGTAPAWIVLAAPELPMPGVVTTAADNEATTTDVAPDSVEKPRATQEDSR